MLVRVTPQVVETIFQASPARARAILRHERDVYTELAGLAGDTSGDAARRAREQFGSDYLEALVRRSASRSVSRSVAQRVVTMFESGNFFGTDAAVVEMIREQRLGRFIQSDHLLEQRFFDAIAEGNVRLTRPPNGSQLTLRDPHRLGDIHALAVPRDEIVYYRLAWQTSDVGGGFELAGLYPHVGPGSKTSALASLIRPTFEGFYSLHDITQATRWVLTQQMGMTPWFDGHVLQDIAHAVLEGIDHSSAFATHVRRELDIADPTEAAIVAFLQRAGEPTAGTFSPDVWPFWGRAQSYRPPNLSR